MLPVLQQKKISCCLHMSCLIQKRSIYVILGHLTALYKYNYEYTQGQQNLLSLRNKHNRGQMVCNEVASVKPKPNAF